MVWISVFGQFGQPRQWIKKVLGANFEQLLRAFFSCFRGQYFFFNFYETPIASAVKNCMIKLSKMKQIELFLHVFWGKNVSS